MNGEKLFKSMNNINQEWIEQAKPANKPVIMRTRTKIYRKCNRLPRRNNILKRGTCGSE